MSRKESFVGKIEIKLKPNQEFITLQSLLQICDFTSTGGMAKMYLGENKVLVNEEEESRRGRKLYPGDEVKISNQTIKIVKNANKDTDS